MKRLEETFRALLNQQPKEPQSKPRKGIRGFKEIRVRGSEHPHPIPAKRPRPLTPDPVNSRKRSRAHPQEQSLLFTRLPLDIRRLIYREALVPADGRELHIFSSNRRLPSHQCHIIDSNLRGWMHDCYSTRAEDGTTVTWMEEGLVEGQHEAQIPMVIGLLCSCRRMYEIRNCPCPVLEFY